MRGFRAQDIARLVTIGHCRLRPDGQAVAFIETTMDATNNRYVSRLYRSECDGGAITALTDESVSVSLPEWAPDGRSIALVVQDLADDDAPARIAILDVSTNELRTICTPPEAPSELNWSPDSTRLAFVARDPDVRYYAAPGESHKAKDTPARKIERFYSRLDGEGFVFDRPNQVFVVTIEPELAANENGVRRVTDGLSDTAEISWFPDGSRIACAAARHDTWDTDLLRDVWILDLDQETVHAVTPTDAMYSLPKCSPSGRFIAALKYATPLAGPCHSQVVVIDLDTMATHELTTELDRTCNPTGSARILEWADEDSLYVAYEDRGATRLVRTPSQQWAPEFLSDVHESVTDFDSNGGRLSTIRSTSATFSELLVDATQLTDVTTQFCVDLGCDIADPIAYQATSTDGVAVDCWAIRPAGPGPFPTILNIHGGPFTQYGYRAFDEFQYQVAAGFAVVYCNPRGSSGYSEQWGRAVRWPECEVDPGTGWGGIDADDVMACVDAAIEQFDWVDASRLGVQGGSYGGYLTTWLLGHSDRFRAGCSERSVNNLVTVEHNSDVATSFVEQVGWSHLEATAAYQRQSPINYVQHITAPMLIIHSEDDLRCPINQAEELFVALRLLGRTPEFWRFPGECHELSRRGAPSHRVQRAEIIIDFFRRHLM